RKTVELASKAGITIDPHDPHALSKLRREVARFQAGIEKRLRWHADPETRGDPNCDHGDDPNLGSCGRCGKLLNLLAQKP
ncbi:MAG: hypothetical protein RJA59_1279, partial [Pseudomonadota bacterium]